MGSSSQASIRAATTAKLTTASTVFCLLLSLAVLANILNLTNGQHHQPAAGSSGALQVAKQWQLFTYNFLPDAPVNDVNFYNPTNILATGVAVNRDRIFIATPQLLSGVSSTISFVSKAEFGDSPVLQAYPDWSFSTTGRTDFNCSDLVLISSYRIRIDSCNRLWVLDAGISRSLEDYQVTCPPKLLVIDLETDQVVRRVDFPREILRGESLFTNLIIDETTSKSGTCDDVFVYISDTVEPAIIVYDSERDVTWRLTHPSMYPDPDFAESQILNHRFILMDGIVGLTFDSTTGIVYFQPLATDRLFSVSKDVLRAGPIALNQVLNIKLVGKKSSQGIGLAVSPIDGSILFSPMTETAIASWNPTTNRQSVLAYDRERLQFVADITTTWAEHGVVYAVSSKFHRFFLKNLDTNEVNNRILRIELPGANPVVTPTPANFASYAPKPLATAAAHFGSFYHTNALHTHIRPSQTPASPTSYFTRPTKNPYSFEPVGVINYSTRNPFTALNQGESFPPSKENRDTFQLSFLDSLVDQSLSRHPAGGSGSGRGYYYARGLRSVKAEETASPLRKQQNEKKPLV